VNPDFDPACWILITADATVGRPGEAPALTGNLIRPASMTTMLPNFRSGSRSGHVASEGDVCLSPGTEVGNQAPRCRPGAYIFISGIVSGDPGFAGILFSGTGVLV
jgi:hypothetical protein